MSNEETRGEFSRQVGKKEARKLKARRSTRNSVWLGFSMFGLVGWSVMIPTVLGVLMGMWLDRHFPAGHSWTLTFLITGLMLGITNAWFWVQKETREIVRDEEDKTKSEELKN